MACVEHNRAVTPDTSGGQGTTGFLPQGSMVPVFSIPSLPEILQSTDNSWDLSPRMGVIADDDNVRPFDGATVSWDAHVYFSGEDSDSTAQVSTGDTVILRNPPQSYGRFLNGS